MARLFPFRSDPDDEEGQPRVVGLEGEDADAVFGALSSTTARRIYARLDEEPGTPSDVADAVDSSIQNVRYHLENLEDAGLVEVVDTWYSSRGNEMSVYATTDGPLIVTSDESTASRLREALSRFVGGIGALAGGSLLVQHGLTRWAESAAEESSTDVPPAGTDETATEDDGETATGDADEPDGTGTQETAPDSDDVETEDEAESFTADTDEESESESESFDADTGDAPAADDGTADAAADGSAEMAEVLVSTVPPGLLFFLGGLVVLLAVMGYQYWYRPRY
ncbi:helix-turn-helix domain-containing protein [Natronolimnohabitans sp. A-GB9]|uniref:ArsR/SmtB family transcription factor n=1 Tax=Natronolimnohabitans sp. A-GB9 TaxID=3069757 RepID=UPI0027B6288C|nr:helix-turn-helix domain-containing protein [Natronolimnohabitans sp. A-GB9]MDQ2050534.1 helix-turn-helix domain-containing protein [Natronolimnohabitans sp. A-GB9]